MKPKVGTVVKLALWSLALLWLATQSTAYLAERSYAKGEQRVLEYAERERVRANNAEAKADSVAQQRDSLAAAKHEKLVYVTRRIEVLPKPDSTCNPICMGLVLPRDSVIDLQSEIISLQERTLAQGREIEAALRGALSSSNARGDSLYAWMQKPKKKPSRIALGGFAGQCAGVWGTGPCIGVGVTYRVF